MRKAIWIALAAALAVPASAADERARLDIRKNPSMLGVSDANGEIRRVKTDDSGILLTSGTASLSGGTVTADQGSAGATEWPVLLSSGTSTVLTREDILAGRSYVYGFKKVGAAPDSLSITASAGLSYSAVTEGGRATINISGGASIEIPEDAAASGEFRGAITDPTINVTALDSGATINLSLDGAN